MNVNKKEENERKKEERKKETRKKERKKERCFFSYFQEVSFDTGKPSEQSLLNLEELDFPHLHPDAGGD